MMSQGANAGSGPTSEAPESTSTSLLERVKAQDTEAWQRLVKLYGPLVYGWCRQSHLQAEDAADVFQEVFAALASHVAEFRRDRPGDSFRAWLATIVRNKIRDHFRRRRGKAQAQGGTDAQQRLAEIPEELPASLVSGSPSDQESFLEHRAMELARAGVEDRTWHAFWRVTVGGQSPAEVAEGLGMNVRAVYEAKYRVMRIIRRELADLAD